MPDPGIPQAAYEALSRALMDDEECEAAMEAAAPHIARAARIAEIRAIADWLDAEADRDFLDADSRPYAADRLRERADEMERG